MEAVGMIAAWAEGEGQPRKLTLTPASAAILRVKLGEPPSKEGGMAVRWLDAGADEAGPRPSQSEIKTEADVEGYNIETATWAINRYQPDQGPWYGWEDKTPAKKVDRSRCPLKYRRPFDDAGESRDILLIGVSTVWNGPGDHRAGPGGACRVCGGAMASPGHYCLAEDRAFGEVGAIKRASYRGR